MSWINRVLIHDGKTCDIPEETIERERTRILDALDREAYNELIPVTVTHAGYKSVERILLKKGVPFLTPRNSAILMNKKIGRVIGINKNKNGGWEATIICTKIPEYTACSTSDNVLGFFELSFVDNPNRAFCRILEEWTQVSNPLRK